jgi:hypothetical protein
MADNTQEQSNARSLNELNKSNLALQKEINAAKERQLALIKKENELKKTSGKLDEKEAKELKEITTNLVVLNKQRALGLTLAKEQRDELKIQMTQYSNIESSIGSISSAMGGLQTDLRNATKLGIDFGTSIANSTEAQSDKYKSANSAAANAISAITSLAQLNKEDAAQIAEYTQEYQNQYTIMLQQLKELQDMKDDGRTKQGKAAKEAQAQLIAQMKSLDEAYIKASKFANMQKDVKELYEEMNEELGAGNKFFQKLINYGKVFFSSWTGAMTVIGFAAGYVADEFGKINAQIGGGFAQLVGFKSQLTAISLILGEEAVGAVTEFGARIGNVNKISNELAFDLGLLPARLGVSGQEAGVLVNEFGNLSNLSNEVALNSLEAASQLAAANGAIPSQVFKDLAQNTELFAVYSKNGGKNLQDAAINAARLGVDLSTAGKISDNLLDYQTSVANEMEASVILGRNLNLQRARELAYAGDINGAMNETLKAAGGIAAYDKMSPIEKRALAAAIGVSNQELLQMIANEKEALKPVGAMTASFNTMSAMVDQIGTTGFGKWLGILPGVFSLLGNIGFAFNTFGTSLPQIWTGLKKWVSGLFAVKAAQDSVNASSAGSSLAGGAGSLTKARDSAGRFTSNKSIAPKMDTSGVDKTSKSVGGAGNNASAMLKGAAALLIAAAAIYVLGLALQQFTKIGANEIISLAGALVVVGLALAAFGAFAAPIMLGAVALGFASIALGMFGAALMVVGNGLSSISSPFGMITENLSVLSSLNITPIYGMATALTALATSLGLVAASGGLALPILSGLNELGIAGVPVGGTATTTTQTTTGGSTNVAGLIEEVKKLTNAIMGEELVVNIDGREIARGMRKFLKNS